MTKTHELKIAPEEECYTEMNLDRTAIEELGKHFAKGFKVGFENIVIGNTQKSIDHMVNALKKEDDE
ncbi:hypothetical protein H9181_002040 [Listeria monocytogenes]|nr:hypothetical protein [Listeria monocytogenes]